MGDEGTGGRRPLGGPGVREDRGDLDRTMPSSDLPSAEVDLGPGERTIRVPAMSDLPEGAREDQEGSAELSALSHAAGAGQAPARPTASPGRRARRHVGEVGEAEAMASGAEDSLLEHLPTSRVDPLTPAMVAKLKPTKAVCLLDYPWLREADVWRAGAVVKGRYKLIRSLGSGGMGDVLLAEDLFLRRKVALKTLRRDLEAAPEALEMFLNEVAMAHAVSHPGLARTYDVSMASGVVFLTMEYLEGETLSRRIKREGPLPESEVRRIGLEVAAALHAAHQSGVIHRDLKPSNIQLTPDRGAVVMDFGLAAAIQVHHPRARPDGSGLQVSSSKSAGTPYYMAPEQWRGEDQGVYTDVYALGCILYEALTGQKPFTADSRVAMMKAHLEQAPPSVRAVRPGVSRRLDRLVTSCLDKDPARRPADMLQIASVLMEGRMVRHLVTALLCLAAVGLLVAGGMVIWYSAKNLVLSQMRPAVRRLAELVARDVDVRDLEAVHTEADMDGPAFRRTLEILRRYKKENPDARYLYTMRKLPAKHLWEFVVDAEPFDKDENHDGKIDDSERGSPPGMKYDSTEFEWMNRVVKERRPLADDNFDYDAWGYILSGYAPLEAPGGGLYIVGVDVTYGPLARLRTILVVVVGVLAAVAMGSILVSRRRKAMITAGFGHMLGRGGR